MTRGENFSRTEAQRESRLPEAQPSVRCTAGPPRHVLTPRFPHLQSTGNHGTSLLCGQHAAGAQSLGKHSLWVIHYFLSCTQNQGHASSKLQILGGRKYPIDPSFLFLLIRTRQRPLEATSALAAKELAQYSSPEASCEKFVCQLSARKFSLPERLFHSPSFF